LKSSPHLVLDDLLRTRIDDRFKGVPSQTPGFLLEDIGAHGWSIRDGDLPLPLLVANAAALEHNIALMQRYCDQNGVYLSPHGKTTMSPQIFRRQLDAGAWGMTVATVEQLAVYRRYGVTRAILANQVAGAGNLRLLARELRSPDLELLVFVDSPQGVRDLEAMARDELQRPVDVLLEIGYDGGRTGARNASAVEAIVAELALSAHVRLRGVAAFEGLLPDLHSRRDAEIRNLLRTLTRLINNLLADGRLPEAFIVTAGGSAAFDLVVEELAGRWPGRATIILRSGCYVTHDHGLYAMTSPLAGGSDPLRPALELWAYVQSRPEPELAYATFGRRDAPYDTGLPTPIARIARGERQKVGVDGIVVEGLNDQHARLRVPLESDLAVGDILIFGISHPCSAFDRWKLLMLVDDQDRVTDGLLTFF
jgi:D-serine dehydratase